MKKNFFMLAATAALFAACAETDLVNEVNTVAEPQAIGFETFANKTTRAIDDSGDLQGAGFQVWGYKAPTATTMNWSNQFTVFDNVSVEYGVYGNGWGYEIPQYRDKTSTYKFYAVAPKTPANVEYTIVPSTGMITITGAKSAISTDSDDFLIDRDRSETYNGKDKKEVVFTFNHIMTKLSFILKAVDGMDETIEVTSLSMHGYDNGLGTFSQDVNYDADDYEDEDAGFSEWTIPTSSMTDKNTACEIINANHGVVVTNSSSAIVGNQYIMVPQYIDENQLYFTISYNIVRPVFNADGSVKKDNEGNDVVVKETFTDQVASVEDAQVWGTDTHFIYTISVGPDIITFNADVLDWTNENEGGENIE